MPPDDRDIPQDEPPNLTAGDAARILGVSAQAVRRWADDGVLPFFITPGQHRRFRRSDIVGFLERKTTSANPEVA